MTIGGQTGTVIGQVGRGVTIDLGNGMFGGTDISGNAVVPFPNPQVNMNIDMVYVDDARNIWGIRKGEIVPAGFHPVGDTVIAWMTVNTVENGGQGFLNYYWNVLDPRRKS